MITVEKLKCDHARPHLTVIDLLYRNNTNAENYLGIYPATHLLKNYVVSNLKNITIGTQYGATGIGINQLLAEPQDLIIETTYHNLLSLPKNKQIALLKNYTIILTDVEEGGCFYGFMGPDLIEHIDELGIIPKKIYSLSAGLLQTDYSRLNIQSVYICVWPPIAMLNDDYYINIVFNDQDRNNAANKIKEPNKTFGLCLNKKPRYDRVKMLAELDQRDLLKHFDWTLLYSKEPLGGPNDYGDFVKSPNNFRFNSNLAQNSSHAMQQFLSKYSLPRLMPDAKKSIYGDCCGPAPDWLGRYYCYISNETYSNQIETSLGSAGAITEKTFKSMCIGAYPLVVGVPGSESKLRELGFKLMDNNYDNLWGRERILAVANCVEKLYRDQPTLSEYALHNFELISSPYFLAKLIATPFNRIANDLL